MGYYKSLRTEKLGKRISVTLICPGPVFSNFLANCFTGKHGEEFGQDVAPSDRRMTTARCAYLSAVAIVNKLDEAWVGVFPIVPITYILVFFPTLSKWIAQFIGTKEIMKLRDSRVVIDSKE
ncbi:hypothetical protein GE061_020112 [Apolygus lucorum]|uniref:Uncharacterized protein n=1 Tax=Apolygus lucorum TaxID=248454 RepID=A0A6A4JLD9_APOLU|nr:hypothetical protein GE061_020112 [Apolygus lucorum]